MTKRLIALPVAIIAVAAFAPGIASAAQINTTTTIAIAASGKAFAGKVGSPANKCKSARNVTLKRKMPNGSSFVNVGSDVTDSAGSWSIGTNPVSGAQYVAVVAKKNVSGDVCKGASSKVTTARQSSTSIARGSNNYHGNVNALSACEPNRKVNLQRKTIYQSQYHNIGSDLTNSNGFWQVNTTIVSGARYRAQVLARQVGANSCMAALSPAVVAP